MDQIITYFLQPQNGILGIIIVMLLIVVGWLVTKLSAAENEIKELNEKRRTESDAYGAKYLEMAKEQVATTKDSINTTNLLQKTVDSIASAFQSFANNRIQS